MPLRDQKVSRTEEFILKPSENWAVVEQQSGNVSIWNEQESAFKPSQNFDNGNMQGFTLNDLVRHLSSEKEYGNFRLHFLFINKTWST